MKAAWQGFEKGQWTSTIDVRDFIQANYKPYEGDETFFWHHLRSEPLNC